MVFFGGMLGGIIGGKNFSRGINPMVSKNPQNKAPSRGEGIWSGSLKNPASIEIWDHGQ